MKSEHRHELKTNELAEWLSNLPEWTKQNLVTIICVSIALVVLAGIYLWRGYNKNVLSVRERTEFTSLVNQVAGTKMQVVQEKEQGNDLAFMFIQQAKSLDAFAQSTRNKRMAALALIKQAQALRAELHYGTVKEQYEVDQTNKAKACYSSALTKSSNTPVLAASAEFGLGLCEEELGNFDEARKIYGQITTNAAYEATVPVAQARYRLATMADYEQKITFKPDPNPEPAEAAAPREVELPTNIVRPFNFNQPLDLSMFTDANEPGGNE